MLPKLNLPTYQTVLPTAKKPIKYRPFTVKDEKNLLIAMQDSDQSQVITSLKNVLSDCTFNEINIDHLTQADFEYLFLMVRNKSMGEGVEVVVDCSGCKEKFNTVLDLSGVKVVYPEKEVDSTIKLGEGLWVKMRFPTLDMGYALQGVNNYDETIKILARCVVNIVQGENVFDCSEHKVEEVVDFLESLEREKFNLIDSYFNNIPKITFDSEVYCGKCGAKNSIHIEGLQDFFG